MPSRQACQIQYNSSTTPYLDFDCDCSWNRFSPCLQPDPDIAGLGVVNSFVVASILTVLLSVLGLSVNLTLNQENRIDQWTSNIVHTKPFFRAWLPQRRRDYIKAIVRPVVISLSDTQLLTGLGTMATAFFRWRIISAYHFAVVADYSSVAFAAHIYSLDVIRWWIFEREEEARERMEGSLDGGATTTKVGSRPEDRSLHHFRILRVLRAVAMTVHFVLLCVAMVLTSNGLWFEWYNCPARCMPKYPVYGHEERFFSIFWVAVVGLPFGVVLMLLFSPSRRFFYAVKHELFTRQGKLKTNSGHLWWRKVLLRLTGIIYWLATFWASQLGSLLIWTAWVIYNLYDLFMIIRTGHDVMEHPERNDISRCDPIKEQTETQWGFGQVLPVLLLFVPLFALVQAIDEYNFERETNGDLILSLPRRQDTETLRTPRPASSIIPDRSSTASSPPSDSGLSTSSISPPGSRAGESTQQVEAASPDLRRAKTLAFPLSSARQRK